MSQIKRRNVLKWIGGGCMVSMLGFPAINLAASRRVVVVGGGIAGATAAKYIRLMNSAIEVTLIEPDDHYYTCFMSNEVLGGTRQLSSIRFGYAGLQKRGINLVKDSAVDIDVKNKKVITKKGAKIAYDRCIVAPGIDFVWDSVKGYNAELAQQFPHAWKAGDQTVLLKDQIRAMRDGGTALIVAPPNPFRCPPGPYERASQMAYYFRKHKPKSKIIIVDPKAKFSKMGLFTAGWRKHYGYESNRAMIEWVSVTEHGSEFVLDAKHKKFLAGVEFKADIINVIPKQKAGAIAWKADLVDKSGWCPVKGKTFESTRHKHIYVIGDASIASPLPKSGYAANSEAKVCAAAVVASLTGKPEPDPSWVNTCYSIITPSHGASVAMVYRLGPDNKIIKVPGAGGLTPQDASDKMLQREVEYAHSWFNNITHDIFS